MHGRDDDDASVSNRSPCGTSAGVARRLMVRLRSCLSFADEGSGTMVGVALIALVACLLMVVAMAGRVLIAQRQAQTAADGAALSAAVRMRSGDQLPCATAEDISVRNGAGMVACHVDDEDVVVEVAVPVNTPFISEVRRSARAGPVPCDAEP